MTAFRRASAQPNVRFLNEWKHNGFALANTPQVYFNQRFEVFSQRLTSFVR